MRRLSILLLILLTCSCATGYKISGPQGGLATTLSLPKGFNPQTGSCDVVLLMHGISPATASTPKSKDTTGTKSRMHMEMRILKDATSCHL